MYRFIDLFAGIGGLHLALEAAGCECVYSSECELDRLDALAGGGLDA